MKQCEKRAVQDESQGRGCNCQHDGLKAFIGKVRPEQAGGGGGDAQWRGVGGGRQSQRRAPEV